MSNTQRRPKVLVTHSKTPEAGIQLLREKYVFFLILFHIYLENSSSVEVFKPIFLLLDVT